MENELIITFENEFVQVISNGEKNYEFSYKLWSNTIKVCQENGCFKILGIAKTIKPVSTLDAFDHGKLFSELGINNKYKIAWVELNPNSKDTVKFIETILLNRGLPGTVFDDIDEATTWLLGDYV